MDLTVEKLHFRLSRGFSSVQFVLFCTSFTSCFERKYSNIPNSISSHVYQVHKPLRIKPEYTFSVCVYGQREDLETELEKAAHYMQFSVAAYGWPIYFYLNPLTGCCKLSSDWCVFTEPSLTHTVLSDFHFPFNFKSQTLTNTVEKQSESIGTRANSSLSFMLCCNFKLN